MLCDTLEPVSKAAIGYALAYVFGRKPDRAVFPEIPPQTRPAQCPPAWLMPLPI